MDFDALGRTDRGASYNGQNGNNYAYDWYQQDGCFDANGNLQFQSYTYQNSGFNHPKECSGSGDTYSHDALGRVTSIAHADGTSISYTYTGRAMQVKDENGVTRITQVDGLGRTTSICEVSSATQQGGGTSAACGQDIAANGYITKYAYTTDSSKDQVTTVTQGVQTRTFVADSLGRTVSVTEPERGTTTYSYAYSSTAGLGLTVTRKRPKANQTSSSTLTTTTTQYDALSRIVSVSYDDSLTPTKTYSYDTTHWAEGSSQTNLKGRLSLASTSNTGTLYSYDAMGRATDTWQCTPSGCGTAAYDKHMTFTYDWTGDLTSEFDPAAGNITYGRSPAGEITSITNNTYTLSGTSGTANLLANAQNGPNGPISSNLGNGLSPDYSYDTLGRINGGWVCVGTPSNACTSRRNGFSVTWSGSRVSGSSEDTVGQGMTYQYDDFNRLTGMKNSAGQSTYTYDYDRYGNRWHQDALQGGGSFSQSYNASNNEISTGGYTYDAAGNMSYDGSHHYTYDAEGNVLQVDSGSTVIFTYDALDHRVRWQTPSAASENLFDLQGRLTSGWTPNNGNTAGTATEAHIFADNTQIAFRSGDGKTYFIHRNWLETDRVHTDMNGATGATFTSLPFGDGGSANVSESYAGWDFDHFAGLDIDGSSNTYPAQYRNYSQAQARWLVPDPYDGSYDATNLQSLNRYAYVLNNPLSYTDPLGLTDCPANDGCGYNNGDPGTGGDPGSGDPGTGYSGVDPNSSSPTISLGPIATFQVNAFGFYFGPAFTITLNFGGENLPQASGGGAAGLFHAPSNGPTPIDKANATLRQCQAQAAAAAQPYMNDVKMPSANELVGTGVLATAASIFTKGNPIAIGISAASVLRKQIGGLINGLIAHNAEFAGCSISNGVNPIAFTGSF